jgi:type I restriction enzyme S subunit
MWKTLRIADFGSVITGKTPSSNNLEHFGDDYPFITPTDMGTGRIVHTDRGISQEGYLKLRRQILPRWSVCFVCIGATIGKICLTTKKSLTNQQINSVVVDTTRHNPFFVYYLLSTYAEAVKSIAGGAATPIVNKTSFENIEVVVPPLPTQHKIASILSAYDDLIENNLRRIKILEEMAQNLYREWFVKFRFPGYQHTRFADSPIGQILEGWEVVKVGVILKKVKRGEKIQQKDYAVVGLIPIIDQGKEFIGGYTDNKESLIFEDLPLIVFGDHTRVLKFIDFPFACGADGTQLLKSNDERMPMSLLYYALSSINLSDFAYARHFKFLKEETLVLPEKSIADHFDLFVSPLRNQTKALMKKNIILRRTRDLLLPRLISGEVDVSELDIPVPEKADE